MVAPVAAASAVQAAMKVFETTPVNPTASSSTTGVGFADMLRSVANNTVGAINGSEQLAMNAMKGDASLQEVVGATISAELSLETAVGIRNKLIESYQEIMRMPI